MIRELYQIRERELSLTLSQGEITEITRKDVTRSGCRVYGEGCTGVAGALGEPGEETWKGAEEALSHGLAWEVGPGEYVSRARDLRPAPQSDGDFLEEMTGVLDTLKGEYPQFIFSNKIRKVERETRLVREGAELRDADGKVELVLIVKHRDSLSPFDTSLEWSGRRLDRDAFLDQSRAQLEAYLHPAQLPRGPWVTVAVTEPLLLLDKVLEGLNGEALGRGASPFSGKVGERIFSPAFTLLADRRGVEEPCVPFFDAEGTALPGDCLPLIEGGVLKRPFADRRTARRFGYEPTAAAGGRYDGAPQLEGCPAGILPSERTLAELTAGGPAIWLAMAAGGDYTAAGDYATPVQTAYLLEEGRPVGRLPEFGLSGNLYQIFGEGWRGLTADRTLSGGRSLVTELKLS